MRWSGSVLMQYGNDVVTWLGGKEMMSERDDHSVRRCSEEVTCKGRLLVRRCDVAVKFQYGKYMVVEDFLFQSQLCVLTLIRCPFHPRVTAVTRKRPRSFCQKCRWQVTPKHAYTLYPSKLEWADYAAVEADCGNLSGNELTRNSSGTLGHSRLSSLSRVESLCWT